MALQPFTSEQLNYFKFAHLVLDEYPRALRQTFKAMWDNTFGHLPGFQPWDDSVAVRNMFLVNEGGTTEVPTHLPYDEWDCTALFQATIFARSFALPDSTGHHRTLSNLFLRSRGLPHGSFHASVISPGQLKVETFALAIDQLRLLRNAVCHSSSSKMDKPTFDQYIQHTKDAFGAIGLTTDPIDTVGKLNEADFTTQKVRTLEDEIRKELQAESVFLKEDVKDELVRISSDMMQLNKESNEDVTRRGRERREEIQELQNQLREDIRKEHQGQRTSLKERVEDEMTQHSLGDYTSAADSAKHALAIRLKLFGEEHPEIADSYYELGAAQHLLEDYTSATESASRALAIRLKLFGEEHLKTADSYHLLGITQHALEDYTSAAESASRALAMRLELFGEEHSDTADSYHLLGVTQHELQDYTSASESTKRALAIRLKLFGEEHSETADSYHELGITQHSLEDYTSATESKKRALNIRLKLFGEEHPKTADSYHVLGITQHSLGQS